MLSRTRRRIFGIFLLTEFFSLIFISTAFSKEEVQVFIPSSSIHQPQVNGVNARTHYKLLVPNGELGKFDQSRRADVNVGHMVTGAPPYAGYAYETPASIACLYNLVTQSTGCNPNGVTTVPNGGSKSIAIVDAYHYPNALSDLQAFSKQFGLAPPNLQVIYANNKKPATSPYSWEVEAALDLQWAHAMAPSAKLYLVEAASNSIADLLAAVKVATTQVSRDGGGQVSMSWGAPEFSAETQAQYESYFNSSSNVVYFASSGDGVGTSWPCVSPNVVCVGGTTSRRDGSNGNFIAEVPWTDGGGGVSLYFSKPSFQTQINSISRRGVPDVSLVADPNTGGWIYYTTPSNPSSSSYPWNIVGGTSWSSPAWAGIVNLAGSFSSSSQAELTKIYGNLGTVNFNDINSGWCGPYSGVSAAAGWDICTGVGTNSGKSGK